MSRGMASLPRRAAPRLSRRASTRHGLFGPTLSLSRGVAGVDTFATGLRCSRNKLEMLDIDAGDTRLRWVYGEYFAPEVTTREEESWAIEETSASYRTNVTARASRYPITCC